MPDLTSDVPEKAIVTHEVVLDADGETSIPDLVDATDVSKSKISRDVQALETAGLVKTASRGKTKVVEPTLAGQLREP